MLGKRTSALQDPPPKVKKMIGSGTGSDFGLVLMDCQSIKPRLRFGFLKVYFSSLSQQSSVIDFQAQSENVNCEYNIH